MTLFSYEFESLLPKDTICLVKIVLVGHERIFESFQSIFTLSLAYPHGKELGLLYKDSFQCIFTLWLIHMYLPSKRIGSCEFETEEYQYLSNM